MVHKGYLGVSDANYTPELAEMIAKSKLNVVLLTCLNILVNFTLACSKLSVVFFYRRIFVTGALHEREWFDIVTIVTIVLIVLWLFVFEFLTGFNCGTHFSAFWDGSYAKYCGRSFPVLYGVAISDFLLDVWVLALPIPKILQIHATPSKKFSVLRVFLLAFIGLGACIARMVLYIRVETGGPSYLFSHSNMRIDTEQFYLNMLEAGMSCLAINLPSLGTLVANFSAERLVHSARSLVSLRSLGTPQGSHSSNSATPNESFTVLDKSDRNCELQYNSSYAGFANAARIEGQDPPAGDCSDVDAESPRDREESIHVTHEFALSRQ